MSGTRKTEETAANNGCFFVRMGSVGEDVEQGDNLRVKCKMVG